MTRLLSVILFLCSCSLILPSHCLGLLSQSFDSSPADWVQINNPNGGNNFGFSNSDFTGVTSGAGESGGSFVRTDQRHSYIDTTIGGSSGLDLPLSFSGELDVASVASDFNTVVLFGYVDASDSTGQFPDAIGLFLAEAGGNSTTQYRAFGGISSGSTLLLTNAFTLDINTDRTFEFDWDPDGGTGSGEFSLTISGAGGGSDSRSLTAPEISGLASVEIDSFGWSTAIQANASAAPGTATVYVDGLQLTAVPEASPVLIWGAMASIGAVLRFRRRK